MSILELMAGQVNRCCLAWTERLFGYGFFRSAQSRIRLLNSMNIRVSLLGFQRFCLTVFLGEPVTCRRHDVVIGRCVLAATLLNA